MSQLNIFDLSAEREIVRPIPSVSENVATQLAVLFSYVSSDDRDIYARRAPRAFLLDQLNKCWSVGPGADPVSILDVKMLYVYALKAGFSEIADGLEKIIRHQMKEAGRPDIAHLTYEDIVLNNPKGDLRTFTTGDARLSEAAFYLGHQAIEHRMALVISALTNAHWTRNDDALRQVPTILREVNRLMWSFSVNLPPDRFHAFKPFFDTIAEAKGRPKEKGPSGAFSAKIPHVDVLLHGAAASLQTIQYLTVNATYFPKDDFAKLKLDIDRNVSGLGSVFAANSSAQHLIRRAARQMLLFRRLHRGTVKKHGTQQPYAGSGEGQKAEPMLDNKIDENVRKIRLLNNRLRGGPK